MTRSNSAAVHSRLKRTPPRVAALVLALVASGCWSARDDAPAPPKPAPTVQEIIGGFAANNSALNAIGTLSLKWIDSYSGQVYFEPMCSASLIDADTALTAKHCIESIQYYIGYGYELAFTWGPSAYMPAGSSEVIAFEGAPGDYGGFNNYGTDVAVLQLDEPLEGIPALQLGGLGDADLGQDFAAIGFGDQDNAGTDGTRRVGAVELRAREGRTYEILLGSFAAFYEWYVGAPLPPECADVAPDPGVIVNGPVFDDADGGVAGDGGFVDCYNASYVRSIFDSVRLEPTTEVVAGGTPGDAQPCYGDSGSPLIRRSSAGLVAYGVVSGGVGSATQLCDYGAVYAAFSADTLTFLEQAKSWVDPCEDLSSDGVCDGSVASRCSTIVEGKRRKLAFDCSAIGLSCEIQRDGGIGCGEDDSSFGPPPIDVATAAPVETPREVLAPIFKRPPQ